MSDKAIFLPLKKKFFLAFASGEKPYEFRRYGNRWNETKVYPGRKVLLSLGYGKQQRLSGVVTSVQKVFGLDIPAPYHRDVQKCYETLDLDFLMIGIKIEEEEKK